MYKRLELHNHTTESDASLTCEDLLRWMEADQVDAFGLTDHNTISGHPKMQKLLLENSSGIQCIYGMEYTTYYGHILCLNLKEYVPWETIDRRRPELLFQAIRDKNALAGIAHPYSYGYPFARGCRFEMELTDYSCVDFIEIFNNPEPLRQVNEKGLLLWEDLVLKGWPIAMTCGMDLHGRWEMGNQFATFVKGEPGEIPQQNWNRPSAARRPAFPKGPSWKSPWPLTAAPLRFIWLTRRNPAFPGRIPHSF
ncbi:CehA/McbA family metallohydrolase [Blautia sp. RD014234]|nr:CehA/McbA family metallohydrolase [Blautia parvula]